MINELEAYLQGEVVQSSWSHFRQWTMGEDHATFSSAKSSRPGTASSGSQRKFTGPLDDTFGSSGAGGRPSPPTDPRALADAHRTYLQALNTALFFTNNDFVTRLKVFFGQIDHFIALFSRLQTVWEGLDLQEDDGVVDAFSNYAQDEMEVLGEMDRTRDSIEGVLLELVAAVREIEKDNRTGSSMNMIVEGLSGVALSGTQFVPWQARTVDRLVMKLDSLAGRHEEERDENAEGYDDE